MKNRNWVKLTLSIDEDIIGKAKKYCKKNKISLSQFIENYLKKVIGKEKIS